MLLSALVGIQLQHVMIYILHTVDQGVTSHVLGNIMRERMTRMAPIQRKQIDELNKDLTAWYAGDGKGQYKLQGKITIDRLKTGSGWAKLKGKAAGTRHLSGYAVHLATRLNSGSEHDARRLVIAMLLHRFTL